MRLKKGDKVKIIRGKDKNRSGQVEKIMPAKNSLLVSEINIVKKHIKSRQDKAGGIVERIKPIASFKAMLICPVCNKPTRIFYRLKNNRKERVCKKCGTDIDIKNKTSK